MFFKPSALFVWSDERVRDRLSWYYEVMLDRKPAKFRICRAIGTDLDPTQASIEDLIKEHSRLQQKFAETLQQIKSGAVTIEQMGEPKFSLLDIKIELAKRMLKKCSFCEWRCIVGSPPTKFMLSAPSNLSLLIIRASLFASITTPLLQS